MADSTVQWEADYTVKKEEDDPCFVCFNGESPPENAIIFCEGCDMAVHQMCYGITQVPSTDWYCDLCKEKRANPNFSPPESCCLCPVPLKQIQSVKRTNITLEGKSNKEWAHLQCAIWNPNVTFGNLTTLSPIDVRCLNTKQQWAQANRKCVFCGLGGKGLCIPCCSDGIPVKQEKCNQWFHVTCAQRVGALKQNFQVDICFLPQYNSLCFPARCEQHAIDLKVVSQGIEDMKLQVGEEVTVLPAKGNGYGKRGKVDQVNESKDGVSPTEVVVRLSGKSNATTVPISRIRKCIKPLETCIYCASEVGNDLYLTCGTCSHPFHLSCHGTESDLDGNVECGICFAMRQKIRPSGQRSRTRVTRYGDEFPVDMDLDLEDVSPKRKRGGKSSRQTSKQVTAEKQKAASEVRNQFKEQQNAIVEVMKKIKTEFQKQLAFQLSKILRDEEDDTNNIEDTHKVKKVRNGPIEDLSRVDEFVRLVEQGEIGVCLSEGDMLPILAEFAPDASWLVWTIRLASFYFATRTKTDSTLHLFLRVLHRRKESNKTVWTPAVSHELNRSWLVQSMETMSSTTHNDTNFEANKENNSVTMIPIEEAARFVSSEAKQMLQSETVTSEISKSACDAALSSLGNFLSEQQGCHPMSYNGPSSGLLRQQTSMPDDVSVELKERINKDLAKHEKFEPYVQGWCKVPFKVRDYVLLDKYQPAPGISPQDKEELFSKLRTTKLPNCAETDECAEPVPYSIEKNGFLTELPCLSHRVGCARSSVYQNKPLRLDKEVLVQNMWGVDCFTRASMISVLEEIVKRRVLQMKPESGDVSNELQASGVALVSDELKNTLSRAGSEFQESTDSTASEIQGSAGQSSTTKAGTETTTDSGPSNEVTNHEVILNDQIKQNVLERLILPVINHQSAETAHEIRNAFADICHACHNQTKQGGVDKSDEDKFVVTLVEKFLQDSAGFVTCDDLLQFSLTMIELVEARNSGYFKVHPKGVGIRCNVDSGIKAGTFVTEYLGELYSPWRWFEKQDAVKNAQRKLRFKPVLPDFYNIMLERHTDDEAGYDVVFVDPIVHGNFASRLCHSCNPNCATVVMASKGKYVICVFAIRDIAFGEELTFDYSSVTEDENEFRAAICLCGSTQCRGSFLYYAGLGAFASVMNTNHCFLHRQAMLLRSCTIDITPAEEQRLSKFGFKSVLLDGFAPWVLKWTSLALEYVEFECNELCKEFLTQPVKPGMVPYTEESAMHEARGVSEARVQNIAITLNKVRYFLAHQGKQKSLVDCEKPLRLLTESEVVSHLWTGSESIANTVIHSIAENKVNLTEVELVVFDKMQALVQKDDGVHTADDARCNIKLLRDLVNQLNSTKDCKFNAVSDILTFWSHTHIFFTCSLSYEGVRSPIVDIRNVDIGRDGSLKSQLPIPSDSLASIEAIMDPTSPVIADETLKLEPNQPEATSIQKTKDTIKIEGGAKTTDKIPLHPDTNDDVSSSIVENILKVCNGVEFPIGSTKGADFTVAKHEPMRVCYSEAKRYQAGFLWGQLSSWFKQTIADPSASLSAERRGTISLPDITSCFRSGKPYTDKERRLMLNRLKTNPHASWSTAFHWKFKNKQRVYGSPWFDDFYGAALNSGAGGIVATEHSHAAAAVADITRYLDKK